MESRQRRWIESGFRQQIRGKRVVTPGIPDPYELMQPELIALLQARVPPRVGQA